MQRRSLILRTGLAGMAAAAAAPAAHAQANVRWRLASSFPKSLETLFGSSETFAKRVSDMSGGKFQISVHAGGELMPPFAVVDGVQNATVEIAHTAPYYFFGKDETFAIGTAIPFGMNSRQITAWMFEGNGLKLLREFYAKFNIVSLPGGNTGAQMGGWYRKELKALGDMKGLKIRTAGLAGEVMKRLGAQPQSIPGGEVYQALERGTIDAAEFVGPYDDQKLGLHKVAPFYHYPGWWEGGAQIDYFINVKAWEALPAEYRAMLEAASGWSHMDVQARYDAKNPAALKTLVSQGAKVVAVPKAILDAAFKESMALYKEIGARNASWKKVYEDYAGFMRDQNLWFRFAEASFDRYMQSVKL